MSQSFQEQISQSFSSSGTISASAVQNLAELLHQPARPHESPPHRPGVLFVSGDPRPNGNLFGPEIAAVRRPVEAARSGFWELACPEPAEITVRLAALRPSVLHVAAHHQNGSIVLSGGGTPLWTGHTAFAELLDVPAPPRLVVLSMCGAAPLAARLDARGLSVVAWPGAVSDDDAVLFAGALYQALAVRMDLGAAVQAGAVLVSHRSPGTPAPLLHRPGPSPL